MLKGFVRRFLDREWRGPIFSPNFRSKEATDKPQLAPVLLIAPSPANTSISVKGKETSGIEELKYTRTTSQAKILGAPIRSKRRTKRSSAASSLTAWVGMMNRQQHHPSYKPKLLNAKILCQLIFSGKHLELILS